MYVSRNRLITLKFSFREIDGGHNPNQVTKDRIERAVGENQFTNGKIIAIKVGSSKAQSNLTRLQWFHSQSYRDLLGAAIVEHFPDLAPHLDSSQIIDEPKPMSARPHSP